MVWVDKFPTSTVVCDISSDWKTFKELFDDDVFKDFDDSPLGVGKLSIDVSIFSSFSYFYILKRLFRVDFAFKEDLLFSAS